MDQEREEALSELREEADSLVARIQQSLDDELCATSQAAAAKVAFDALQLITDASVGYDRHMARTKKLEEAGFSESIVKESISFAERTLNRAIQDAKKILSQFDID